MFYKLLCFHIIVALSMTLGAKEIGLIYRVQPGHNWDNNNSIFGINSSDFAWARNDLVLNYRNKGFYTEWSGVQRLKSGENARYKGVLNEAYWDGSLHGWEVTLGKKK